MTFSLADHHYDAQRDLLLAAMRDGDPVRSEAYAKVIRSIAEDRGHAVGVYEVIKQGKQFIDTVKAARDLMRPKVSDKRIDKYLQPLPEADAVFSIGSARDRGWARMQRRDDEYGHALPWKKLAGTVRLRPSETTIWAGPNGSWKSATVNFVLGHLAWHGVRCFVASLELTVEDQISRLAWQMLRNRYPIRQRFDLLMDRLNDNLTVYDFVGQIKPERALALARYAATDLQARHVLIDNLTMTVPPGRDADEKSARFIAGLYQVGRDTGCHMHLIAHIRKPSDENAVLSRYDIRGTGAAPDQVDNVFLLSTNERKFAARERGEHNPADPDLFLRVDKQRHAAFRGRVGFWMVPEALRLAEHDNDPVEAYC